MAIKTIEYTVNTTGILPANEQVAGTQGDHKVTQLKFNLSQELYDLVSNTVKNGRAMYRFDVYDGEGGIWQSEPTLLDIEISFELEERHTRFGGKIMVYLVITALSSDNETEMELYSFPMTLKLKNRPEGVQKEGENYESVTGLAEVTKQKSAEANLSAQAAENSKKELQEIAAAVEEKLLNGEFDGVGVESAEIIDDELVITYTDGTLQNLGNVKGATGEQGIQGEKGDKGDNGADGKDAVVEQSYNAESQNAQSGVAVAEALNQYVKKVKGNGHAFQVYAIGDSDGEYYDATFTVEDNGKFEGGMDFGNIPHRQGNGNLLTNTPIKDLDCANKKYVDDAVKNIDVGDIDVDVSGKLDKIPSTQTKTLENVNGWIGAYVTNDTTKGDARLARIHYNWEPYTIPYRLTSGQIHVGMSGWDEITGESRIFQDAAVPKSYLAMVRNVLENSITAARDTANKAQATADSKKLTSSYTRVKTTLDFNSVYILWSNSGNADIVLYNSENNARIADTAGDNLPAARVAVLLLPTSSREITSEGISKNASKRCLYLGVTGTPSILSMNVTSKQFVVESGDLCFTPSTTGVSVFKIAL